MESVSLVSKAKTAFHSAAAKAEKVFTDIKTDLRSDRGDSNESESMKYSRKQEENESQQDDSDNKSKDVELSETKQCTKWKIPFKERKDPYPCSINFVKETSAKEKAHNCQKPTSEAPSVDGDLSVVNQPSSSNMEDLVQITSNRDDQSSSSHMFSLPPVASVKQLALAIENGKKFRSMKDILESEREFSNARDKSGLSFSVMKSLVLREKEGKCNDTEEVLLLIPILFETDSLYTEEDSRRKKNAPQSATTTIVNMLKDIHGAPPDSFVIRLSNLIGNLKTLLRMATFWSGVISEFRRLWIEGKPIPHMPLDENPNLDSCRLHQQLQVINCCINRKRRRYMSIHSFSTARMDASPNSEYTYSSNRGPFSSALFARVNSGDLVPRLGADHPFENLTMIETGEPVYTPITQEGPILTVDLIKENEELVLRTGSFGAGCSQLLSDMQAFKAANPGCILEDFIRWYSPPDWTETKSSSEKKNFSDGGIASSIKGQLSSRMQKEGNLWRELWETAKSLPAMEQTPLFDEDLAVENILCSLEEIQPVELFEQLFVSTICSGIITAEAAIPSRSNLSKLFSDCKEYLISTLQYGDYTKNIDDICQVYETIDSILNCPNECLAATNQSDEMASASETKRRFKRINFHFGIKDKSSQKAIPKDSKNPEESQMRVFSSFFDKKSSLFSKKQRKQSKQTCTEDSD